MSVVIECKYTSKCIYNVSCYQLLSKRCDKVRYVTLFSGTFLVFNSRFWTSTQDNCLQVRQQNRFMIPLYTDKPAKWHFDMFVPLNRITKLQNSCSPQLVLATSVARILRHRVRIVFPFNLLSQPVSSSVFIKGVKIAAYFDIVFNLFCKYISNAQIQTDTKHLGFHL